MVDERDYFSNAASDCNSLRTRPTERKNLQTARVAPRAAGRVWPLAPVSGLPRVSSNFLAPSMVNRFSYSSRLISSTSLHFLAPVKAMPRSGFLRPQRRKFGFPETQHVRLDAGQARNFADPEIKLIGNFLRRLNRRVFRRAHDVPLS